jgi:hypothetical protein
MIASNILFIPSHTCNKDEVSKLADLTFIACCTQIN